VPSRVAAPRNTSRPSRGAALRNSEKPEFITTAAFLSDHPQKTKNYLPDVSRPEVEALLTRTDMAALPLTALEQHGHQLPTGTDFFIGVEEAKLIAQKTDVLVAPILLPGISPYHVEFPGTIALSPDTFQRVYFEAAQSLIKHGFRRFLLIKTHVGNQSVSRYIIDRINQETPAVAVELADAAAHSFRNPPPRRLNSIAMQGWARLRAGCIFFPHWWTCRMRGPTACSCLNTEKHGPGRNRRRPNFHNGLFWLKV
jgi:hypothetical protein